MTFRIYSSGSSSFRTEEQIPLVPRQKYFREVDSAEHNHESISTAQAVDHQRHRVPTIHSSRGTLCPGQIHSHTSILPPPGLCLSFRLSSLKEFSTIPLLKIGLKLNIQKTNIMASGHITSWQIDEETVVDFILGGSKITADGDCSHEIKRHLLLGRKVMTNPDIILKSRDITLPTKVCLVKAMVFPVVMYGRESWTIKKAEHQVIDAFEVWCWRRLLRVPWTARTSNQSILKESVLNIHWKDWC